LCVAGIDGVAFGIARRAEAPDDRGPGMLGAPAPMGGEFVEAVDVERGAGEPHPAAKRFERHPLAPRGQAGIAVT